MILTNWCEICVSQGWISSGLLFVLHFISNVIRTGGVINIHLELVKKNKGEIEKENISRFLFGTPISLFFQPHLVNTLIKC